MKPIIIIILTLVCLACKGQSQYIGVKTGLNRTNVTSNLYSDKEIKQSMIAGLTYDFHCQKNILLGAELLYEQRGCVLPLIFTNANGNPTGQKYNIPLDFRYLSVPLKIGYSTGRKLYVFGNIGFCPSFLLIASTKLPWFDISGNYIGDSTQIGTKNFSRFDLGGLMELGCGYKLNKKISIYSSAKYQHSVLSYTRNKPTKDYPSKHYGSSFNLGIIYRLSK